MKKYLAVFLALICAGCLTWSRTWILGTCRQTSSGSYGCTVTVPKCGAGIEIRAQIVPETLPLPSNDLKVKITNYETRVIVIEGIPAPFVYLAPGGTCELVGRRGMSRWTICGFDTSEHSIKLGIELLGEKPKDGPIQITGFASDGP